MTDQKPVVVLLGPQGSGKGTQGKRLAKKFSIPYLETGQLLRGEIASGSARGTHFASIMDSGGLLPDEDVIGFMKDKIRQAHQSAGGFVLDGFPRRHKQADALDDVVSPTHVLLIDIPDVESIRRLSARRQCPKDGHIYNMVTALPKHGETCDDCGTKLVQRDDDTPEAIQKRLDLYNRDTKQLIERYERAGILHRIDGTPDIPEVEKLVWIVFA